MNWRASRNVGISEPSWSFANVLICVKENDSTGPIKVPFPIRRELKSVSWYKIGIPSDVNLMSISTALAPIYSENRIKFIEFSENGNKSEFLPPPRCAIIK